MPDRMTDGPAWPKISIVTPSFNQGQFIEETIRSVLLQGYPDLEYIIVDGGSRDQTLAVIRNYEKWLAHWESKSDRGQSHAINKGWLKGSGDIVGWVNSDDFLLAASLNKLALSSIQIPETTILAGDVLNNYVNAEAKSKLMRQSGYSIENFVKFWESWTDPHFMWHQPGVFFTKSVISTVGLLDETLLYTFDYDYMCRALQTASILYLGEPLASFRVHADSKTTSREPLVLFELFRVSKRYWSILDVKNSLAGRKFVIQRSLIAANRLPIRRKLRFSTNVLLQCLLTDPVETISYTLQKIFLRLARFSKYSFSR